MLDEHELKVLSVAESFEWLREAIQGSFEEQRNRLSDALSKKFPRTPRDDFGVWVVATFPNRVVYRRADDLWEASWSEKSGGTIKIGDDPVKVKKVELFQTIKESVDTFDPGGDGGLAEAGARHTKSELDTLRKLHGQLKEFMAAIEGLGGTPEPDAVVVESMIESCQIIEALDADDEDGGWKWGVRLIKEGVSKNRRYWSKARLKELVPLAEGSKAYNGHQPTSQKNSSSVDQIVGFHSDVKLVESNGKASLTSVFTITENAKWLRDAMVGAWKSGKKDLIGFSIDAAGKAKQGRQDGVVCTVVESVFKSPPVRFDVVSDPSAGGEVERLIASEGGQVPKELSELFEGLDIDSLTESRPDLVEEIQKLSTKAQDDKGGESGGMTEADRALLTEAQSGLSQIKAERLIEASGLPDAAKVKVLAGFEGRVVDADAVQEAIKSEKDYLGTMTESGVITGHGNTRDIQVTGDEADRKSAALDGMISGTPVAMKEGDAPVRPYMSLHEAYIDISGSGNVSTIDAAKVLRESMPEAGRLGQTGQPWADLRESLTSSSWGQLLGDSIARQMIADYRVPGLDDWRKIVSNIANVKDFRTNRRGRMGGYGTLPDVAQSGTYQPLTSPTDEEATYAVVKKGGLEDLTEETIANDDIGAVRQIPRKLGRAAAQTLYRGVFDLFVDNDNATYDSVALFHATHSNLGSTALSAAELTVVTTAMNKQAAYNNSTEVLNIMPQFLLLPPDLRDTGFRITNSEFLPGGENNDKNIHATAQSGLSSIIVPYWSDVNNWYAVANPMDVPTIEVGFYQGKQEPELWVQDSPTVGSNFTADKITYKIRHIWQVVVLDHRGMYGEVVG